MRRHKINSVKEGKPNNPVEDTQQEELYGKELKYKAKDEEKENTEEKPYTKTDINKMNKASLQELAAENEIDGAYDMTGEELKEALIEHFGL